MTTSEARTAYENIGQQIKELDLQRQTIDVKIFEFEKERNIIAQKLIVEEKLLTKTKWSLLRWGGRLALLAKPALLYQSTTAMNELANLVRKSWHGSFELEQGVSLEYNDNDFTLEFKDPKTINSFVERNGLEVEVSKDLTGEIEKLKSQLEVLQDWL